MPNGTNRESLLSVYSLSPGAYAKVSGKMQVSRGTLNNFNNPVIFRVYAENRDIQREWTIIVHNARNLATIESPGMPGMIAISGKDSINSFK